MKRLLLPALLFALIGERIAAQDGSPQVIRVWPNDNVPGERTSAPEQRRSPERTDAIRITNVSSPTLTWFAVNKRAPAVIVCPGGGYNYVVVDKEGSEVAKWLHSTGRHAFVLKYRNPQNRSGALQDLQRAVSLLRANAEAWKIDSVGVMGFSAGGHLCAQASTRFGKRTYSAMDEVDKESCRPDFAVLVYPAYLNRQDDVAPELDLKADIPPTLIVHNEDDRRFVVGSKVYAAALKRANRAHKFLLYPTGGHGYGLRSEQAAKAWPKDAEMWLQATAPIPANANGAKSQGSGSSSN